MGALSYKLLKKLFLSGYPLNKWCWPDVFELLMKDSEDGIRSQNIVLKSTVHHYLTQKFPIKISYQLIFLKTLINKLEESNIEIGDEFYEAYCQLLGKSQSLVENETERHYRHFLLNEKHISLRESNKLVSEGTTGLHAWQASMALAEWCLEHQDIYLKGKKILELGSGVGLTGLACILGTSSDSVEELPQGAEPIKEEVQLVTGSSHGRQASSSAFSPLCFTFSDCHSSVLQLLCQNIKENILDGNVLSKVPEKSEEINERVLFDTDFHGTKVRVLNLPWEDLKEGSEEAVDAVGEVDHVIAADVVYDQSLFTPLVGSLKNLLSRTKGDGTSPSAIIACTMRDPETIKEFLDHLSISGLMAVEEEAILPQHFVYEPDPPVCIYTVTL